MGVLRAVVLIVAVLMAVRLGWRAATPPAALPASAPATVFSAGRALADVRAVAMHPHPTGSTANAGVSAYLAARIAAIGMQAQVRHYLIDDEGLATLKRWSGGDSRASELTDVIGILPGRDRHKPAVVLMAHYDTVWGSPGAGDDSAGVAAALEIARAVKARGGATRDLILLLTDGEEIGLSGARAFWKGDALAKRAGVVVNLEARGTGGRATMFETGAGNAAMMALFARSVATPVASSLSVLAYRHMPNDTDFTPVRERGLPGFNFAILGRAAYYHSPQATIDRLDPRSVQDLGTQALDLVAALVSADDPPAGKGDAGFFDLRGRRLVLYRPGVGWLAIVAICAALVAAGLGAARAERLRARSLLTGAGALLWLVVHAALGLTALNLLSGSARHPDYYDRLAALPALETQAVFVSLAVLAGYAALRAPIRRWMGAAPAVMLVLLCAMLGGLHGQILALGLTGALLGMVAPRAGATAWGGWLGALGLLLVAAIVVQMKAPTIAWIFLAPVLVLSLAAALVAWLDPRFDRAIGLLIAGAAAVAVATPLLPLAHLAFLGVGAGMPLILLLFLPSAAAAFWPIARNRAGRATPIVAGFALLAAAAIALSVRANPLAPSVPGYGLDK